MIETIITFPKSAFSIDTESPNEAGSLSEVVSTAVSQWVQGGAKPDSPDDEGQEQDPYAAPGY